MLADPQSITIGSATIAAPRFLTGTTLGRFSSADGSVVLEAQTAPGNRIRTVARLVQNKISPDPLTSVNTRVGQTLALTINRPLDGFTEAEVLDAVKGFVGWLNANTDKVLKQIIAGEN